MSRPAGPEAEPEVGPAPTPQEEWPQWAAPGPTTDPAVSRAKFDREISEFQELETRYREEGVLLLQASYPTATLAFAAPHLRPAPPVVFGIEVDFTNYDAQPLAVRFIDPFTGRRLVGRDLPPKGITPHGFWTQRRKGDPTQTEKGIELPVTGSLVQGGPDDWPFLCIPGTREYHQNPYHSNDPWLAHRAKEEGTLQHIVETLVVHGIEPVKGYAPQFGFAQVGPAAAQVQVVGFTLATPFESLPRV